VTTTVAQLDTPALLFHLDVVEANLGEMAAVAAAAGVRLRPHTKTHKSPELAAMQMAHGAAGLTVAKLGEAEVMADAGLDDLLIAYPLVGELKLRRLHELLDRGITVRCSLDSVAVAQGLGSVGRDRGTPIEVLVEVDTGLHRLGRPPGAPTVELVTELAGVRGVEVVGLLTHAGHAYGAADSDELRRLAEREGTDLVETAEACARAGIELREISVGSTPTARIVADVEGVTEIRPGTYLFNDVDQMRLGVADEASCAARILATVVATPWEDRFVIDAGSKCLTSDGGDGPPFPGRGVIVGRPDLRLDRLSEEHGVGHVEPGGTLPAIGERLEVIPLHVCPVVNLFDEAHGIREGRVERTFSIAGRGKVW
jgi:D-serine deaminase-like pyridoxal phosphate-dependent protein